MVINPSSYLAPVMDKKDDTCNCVAFDEKRKCCTIYDRRPQACRDFDPGCPTCLSAVKSCKNGESRNRILKSLTKLNEEKKKQEARKMLKEMNIA
jgi:Fe-S-cluster containining protein